MIASVLGVGTQTVIQFLHTATQLQQSNVSSDGQRWQFSMAANQSPRCQLLLDSRETIAISCLLISMPPSLTRNRLELCWNLLCLRDGGFATWCKEDSLYIGDLCLKNRAFY